MVRSSEAAAPLSGIALTLLLAFAASAAPEGEGGAQETQQVQAEPDHSYLPPWMQNRPGEVGANGTGDGTSPKAAENLNPNAPGTQPKAQDQRQQHRRRNGFPNFFPFWR